MRCTISRNVYQWRGGREWRRGAVFHPCQSYPQSQSTFHLDPPTHSSSGTLAAIRLGVRKTSLLPACCFSVSHSLSCERPDLWANRKRCARVIAQLRSRWRRGASIRRLPDVTDIYKPPSPAPQKKKTLIVWGFVAHDHFATSGAKKKLHVYSF